MIELAHRARRRSRGWAVAVRIAVSVGVAVGGTGCGDESATPTPAKRVEVPSVIGMPIGRATETLKRAGFRVNAFTASKVTLVKPGEPARSIPARVLGQGPRAHSVVPAGSLVQLSLSKGEERRTARWRIVPDVVGRPARVAEEQLLNLGLQVQTEEVVRRGAPRGRILKQAPRPGARALEGSTIGLTEVVRTH
jgi:beta-lactam-binding protein with PASTA domain